MNSSDRSLSSIVTSTMENGYDNPASFTDSTQNCAMDVLESKTKYSNGNVLKPNETNNGVFMISNGLNSKSTQIKNGSGTAKKISCKKAEIQCNGNMGVPEYDPHKHRTNKHPTSYWDTVFHLLKASLGTGILAMPNAFRNAGYLIGLAGTLFIGFVCTYNIHILLDSEYALCRKRKIPHMSYPETVQAAFEEGPEKLRWFSSYGRFITNLFLVLYQIGSSAIYIVFIATNLQNVYKNTYEDDINVRLIMLYMLVPLILICWVRNLKLLVPFSTIANMVTILSFVLIFYYIFKDGTPTIEDKHAVGSIHGLPLFFGTVLFAMEAIGMIMPLKNNMNNPKKFGSMFGVLNASMLPITLLYTFIGFFGYLKYGDSARGSITLNLSEKELLANLVRILYSASIFITYALSCYVAFDIIWTNHFKLKVGDSKFRTLWQYVVRTSIVFITFLMAVAIPNLEVFISFIGAFCLSTMGVAFPAIVQTLVFWKRHQSTLGFSLFILKNLTIVMIAVLAFTIGVSTSIAKIFSDDII